MKPYSNDYVKPYSDDCFETMTDLTSARERLRIVDASLRSLRRYNEQRHRIERCPNSGRQLAERAYEAEKDLRIILKMGLDTLNELVDSGRLESAFHPEPSQVGKQVPFYEAFNGVKQFFSGHKDFADIDTTFLDDAMEIFREHDVTAEWTRSGLLTRFKDATGEIHAHQLDARAMPGDLGRISAREFFSAKSSVGLTPMLPALGDEDCHHEKQTLIHNTERLAAYDTLVGVFGLARESMYRHARVVDRFGRAHLRGEDPLTAALIILGVVAAAALVAGVTIMVGCAEGAWTGNICFWGLGLFIGGGALGAAVACIYGLCKIVLSGLEIIIMAA
jgi:hypothetical protein